MIKLARLFSIDAFKQDVRAYRSKITDVLCTDCKEKFVVHYTILDTAALYIGLRILLLILFFIGIGKMLNLMGWV